MAQRGAATTAKTGTAVCAASTTCTSAEVLLLSYEAARLAKAAAEAALVYVAAVEALGLSVTDKTTTAYATGTAALAIAYSAALAAQTAANSAITSYNALASAWDQPPLLVFLHPLERPAQ